MFSKSTLAALDNKSIIEFGCGVGRFTTRLLQDSKQVVALDFSLQSLNMLASKLTRQSNVGLVLADATQMRAAPGAFDLALSTQVIEHFPTREQRGAFIERVYESLTPNGIFVCIAYHQDLRRRLSSKEVEGFHSSGIFFHRFTLPEIKSEIKHRRFRIIRTQPIQIQLPLTRRLRLPMVWLSRQLENIPVLREFGNLVLVKAEKPLVVQHPSNEG